MKLSVALLVALGLFAVRSAVADVQGSLPDAPRRALKDWHYNGFVNQAPNWKSDECCDQACTKKVVVAAKKSPCPVVMNGWNREEDECPEVQHCDYECPHLNECEQPCQEVQPCEQPCKEEKPCKASPKPCPPSPCPSPVQVASPRPSPVPSPCPPSPCPSPKPVCPPSPCAPACNPCKKPKCHDECHDDCHDECNDSCHDSCHDDCHDDCHDECDDSCSHGSHGGKGQVKVVQIDYTKPVWH